ncbi:MAG: ATP-binding cassette domain-containing protein [Desulfovibrionaceae bacterium]
MNPPPLREGGSVRLSNSAEAKFGASLAAQVLKLLALVAQTGREVSEARLGFVRSFYGHLYPGDIAVHFFERFERYVDEPLDLGSVCSRLNERLSYQEKVFCLIIVYQFIMAEGIHSVERRIARATAKLLHVGEVDVRFLEHALGVEPAAPEVLEKTRVFSLAVTGDPQTADVLLPFPGLDLLVLKVLNLYCITKRTDACDVVVDGYSLKRGISTRVSHNYVINIDDYELKHHDLKAYFENKVNPLDKTVYVVQEDVEPEFAPGPGEHPLARIRFSGSRVAIAPMDDGALVSVGGGLTQAEAAVNLDDSIYVNGYRLNLRELFYDLNSRRELSLSASRTRYLISNSLRADLHVRDELGERWSATLTIDSQRLRYVFDTGDCPYQTYLNQRPVRGEVEVRHGDVISIHSTSLALDLDAGIVRKSVFGFNKFIADRVTYTFDDGAIGLDDVTLDVEYGELVAVMGPSGSGKSTLLRVMSGLGRPDSGAITLDQYDLHRDYQRLKDRLAYVPQEDMLLGNLTVYENLYYYGKLRFPDRGEEELAAKIGVVLADIGLTDRRDARVGDVTDKVLSGGERKRLNIGLELLADADVYLLDEPTSGLSSKDSEKLVELLANITLRGKMVICVVHQPGPRIYKMFNKVVILDKGGKLAFHGTAYAALHYFRSHMEKHSAKGDIRIECPTCKTVEPVILLDSLEESLRDIDGTVLGQRIYSPAHWQREFKRRAVNTWFTSIPLVRTDELPPGPRMGPRERIGQFATLFSRNLKSKLRDRSNLLITFLEAPLLGAGVGFILRYSPADQYTLYTNDLFNLFLFVAVIVTAFLSMTSSVVEIIGDSALFLRERMLNLTNRTYLGAKLLVLLPFALAQNVLFILLGFALLEVRELYLQHILYLTALSYTGISAALCISALPGLSARAAQNVVPLMLVPQIILGGALVAYEKMNRSLTIVENSPIPEICQVMPSRWAYEGVMVLQEAGNSYHGESDRLSDELREVKRAERMEADPAPGAELAARRAALEARLESFRETHRYAYGNKSVHDAVLLGQTKYEDLLKEHAELDPARAEGIVDSAEADLRIGYPLFVREKVLPGGFPVSTAVYNLIVLLLMGAILNVLTLGLLKYRDDLVRQCRRTLRRSSARFGRLGAGLRARRAARRANTPPHGNAE